MAAAVPNWSLADAAGGTTTVVPAKPPGLASGEHVLAMLSSFSTAPTIAAPSGFTTWQNGGNFWFSWKLAGGSEPSTYTFTRSVNTTGPIVVALFRVTGADPTNPFDVYAGVSAASGASSVIPSVTATLGGLLLSVLHKQNNVAPTITPPSGMTTLFDDSSLANSATSAATQSIAAGATGTKTWTASGTGSTNGYGAGHIVINNAPTTASGTATVDLTASAAARGGASGGASLTLSASGAAAAIAAGAAALALSAGGVAAAQTAGTASLALSAAATPSAPAAGTASLSLSAGATVTPAAAGTASLSLSASGAARAPATSSASLSLTATGTGRAPAGGTAALTLGATGTAGQGSTSSALLNLSATGAARAALAGTANLTVSATGTATARAAGTAQLTLTATGTAGATRPAAGSAYLDLSAQAAASALLGSTALLELTATGTAAAVDDRNITIISITLAPSRHRAELADSVRHAGLLPSRHSARIEADMTTLYRGTTEYLDIPVTSDVQLTDTVEVSFDDRATWHPAFWIGSPGTTRTARLLLGSSVALPQRSTNVYVRFTDTIETPVLNAGVLTIA